MEEKPWKHSLRPGETDIVPVTVNFTEKMLRNMLKEAGGKWDPEEKLWFVPYGTIRGTELEERIHLEYIKANRKA